MENVFHIDWAPPKNLEPQSILFEAILLSAKRCVPAA